MKAYGWINWNEFKELPIPTVLSLLDLISEEEKEMEKEYNKMRKR